jgi:hypothetical protein
VGPLGFQAGTLLTSPANGTLEYDASAYYLTVGGARHTLAYLDSNISGTAANVSGTVALANGGTGATTVNGRCSTSCPAPPSVTPTSRSPTPTISPPKSGLSRRPAR